ncbi:hypothetical protein DICVIV_13072 [Dictyocaulus viviparus]|uniref:Neurotransmitter-gated ion-channel ligand-binding domain-containing protein n=1 Tax=Dictyocaulus viviparus TaxID=29172 RepID=A0A0D8X8Q9_DICVI|nr:hypothetical protein DICVIV_13072 [Dictyocaulus viviparus]
MDKRFRGKREEAALIADDFTVTGWTVLVSPSTFKTTTMVDSCARTKRVENCSSPHHYGVVLRSTHLYHYSFKTVGPKDDVENEIKFSEDFIPRSFLVTVIPLVECHLMSAGETPPIEIAHGNFDIGNRSAHSSMSALAFNIWIVVKVLCGILSFFALVEVLEALNKTRATYAVMVYSIPIQIQLVHDLLDKYDKKAKPTWNNSKPINVSFSMDLYQILELRFIGKEGICCCCKMSSFKKQSNEPQQYILLNAWIIELFTLPASDLLNCFVPEGEKKENSRRKSSLISRGVYLQESK